MNIFTQHPKSIGESYFQHMKFAGFFGVNMLFGGLACIVHAIFPFLFQKTGSEFLLKTMNFYIQRMPEVDQSIIELSTAIENKKAKVL